MEHFRKHWPVYMMVAIGILAVGVVNIITDGSSAVLWAGGIVGVLVGVAIASMQNKGSGKQ